MQTTRPAVGRSWRARARLWFLETRAPFFTAVVVPVLLGTLIAWARQWTWHWGYFLLTLVGGVCLHAGTNIANDYFDHLSGDDAANVEFVRPFTGGSRMIQEGLMSPREVLTEALVFFALAIVIGLYLTWARGWVVLILGLIGLFSGYFYTAPPFRLANLGIGEFVVGANFGILVTLGAYFVQTQRLAWEPVIAAIPVACLIAAVLWINELPDMVADKSVGKNHLVARLGKARAAQGYVAIMALTYAAIVVAVLLRAVTPWALLGLLTVPLTIQAVRTALRHYAESPKLAPANAATIQIHLLTGLLLCLAYIVERLV